MLAKLKRGMPFKDAKNNTWVLQPDDEVSVGSKWEREAETAKELLKSRCRPTSRYTLGSACRSGIEDANRLGMEEEFTDLAPRQAGPAGNNNNNPPPTTTKSGCCNKQPKRPYPQAVTNHSATHTLQNKRRRTENSPPSFFCSC